MGMSKSKQKSTSTSAPSAAYAPQIDAAAASLQPGYAAAQTNNMGLMSKVNSAMDASGGYYGDVLGGKYLDGNPHLQGVIDASNRDITSGVNSQFEGAGRYGSGMHADILARDLAQNENQLRYGDYNTERGFQQQAASQYPATASLAAGTSSALPQAAGSTYAAGTGGLLGKYGTQTGITSSSPSTFDQIQKGLGTAMQLASFAFSDARLKTDIRRVGSTDDGLGVYTYRYHGESKRQMGVMAHEVAEIRPEALGPTIGGFATVNYGAL